MINLDQTPHPLVEDHHHIRDLIYSQERRTADRKYHQERLKSAYEREEDIKKYPDFVVMDFWCQACKKDFVAQVHKQVEKDWTNQAQDIAFYKTKCWRGHWCVRLITDRFRDGYYVRSIKVSRDRLKGHLDTLQPFEEGFNMVYGKPGYTKPAR